MDRLNPLLITRFHRFACWAAGAVIFLSLLVLIGWATNIVELMRLCPGDANAVPFMGRIPSSAAITLILYGASLLLIMLAPYNKSLRLTSDVLAAIGVLGAITAIVVTATGEDFDGIRLFQPDPAALGVTYPVPLALEMGVDLVFIGAAILLIRWKNSKSLTPSQVAVLAAIPIPMLIVLGAATQIKQLCALGGCFTMSTGYAILALLFCGAIFLSTPREGAAALYAGLSTGSLVLRRATLFLSLIPVLLIIRSVSLAPLELTQEVGWVVFVFSTLVLAVAFLVPGVKAFNRIESELSTQLSFTRDELEKTRQSRSSMDAAAGVSTGMIRIKYKRVCLTCAEEYDDSVIYCPDDDTELSRIIDDNLLGTVFAEKYEIKDLLGSGGMSTVYKAYHKFLNKEVAIKVLKGNTASSTDSLKRFQREARATGSVEHPGIVSINDFGLAPDGRAFLVMDYLPGESVSDLLDRVGPLTVPHVVALASQICDALAAAHEGGVVHRDLKPSNIMLVNYDDGTAQAKIVDFGLAKIIDEDSRASKKITRTGDCFGSPLYMSPEQCMGKSVDHRSDLYSLGCILYETLTGYPPIMGDSAADTIRRQVTERPAPLPSDIDVPKQLRTIIYQCLQKDAAWRPQSARNIQDVLATVHIW